MADVEVPQYQRYTKGQGLLQNEGPPTYAILSRNLVLSQFTRFLIGHHRAFYESHPSLGELSTKFTLAFEGLSTKVSLLSERFRRAFVELSESFRIAFEELSESFCKIESL